jgi:hypothetical protein
MTFMAPVRKIRLKAVSNLGNGSKTFEEQQISRLADGHEFHVAGADSQILHECNNLIDQCMLP